MAPKRIQRRRTKGWRMPEGARYVGRGSIWGNPFRVGEPCGVFPKGMGRFGKAETLIRALSRSLSLHFYRRALDGFLSPEMYPHGHDWRDRLQKHFGGMYPKDALRSELRGHDLACWCKLCPKHKDKGKPLTEYCPHCDPCHIDVIAELLYGANSEARRG